MALGDLLNLVSTFTLVVGVVFGLVQLQHFRARRRREAMLALATSYQTPAFVHAMRVALDPAIPDGLGRAELEARLGPEIDSVWLLLSTWESLGVLVCRREIELAVVDDLFSGVLQLCRHKFAVYVEELRADLGRDTYFEWFQWLAERFMERERLAPPVPGHVAHRAWRP